MAEHELDARGLSCPLPVLKARKLLKSLPGGAELRVLATDAKAPSDFQHFCDASGHDLVASSERDAVFHIVVRKRG